MARVRISTTVDDERLRACRERLGVPDSQVVDRALMALLNELEEQAELTALDGQPYEEDPDLSWQAPPGPDLPYEGDVPADVIELAEQRRARRR